MKTGFAFHPRNVSRFSTVRFIALVCIVLVCFVLLPGCTFSSHYNDRLVGTPIKTRASFNITDTSGNDDVLVALAISGGGSRASYLGAVVMLKLQTLFSDVDLMKEVDVISSVSGGSIPAAYYCISKDKLGYAAKSGRIWERDSVKELMTRNFQARWIGNWFWPSNILRFTFTAYDRSDTMAQTLEDNLFDTLGMGSPLTFKDLNPERPYLIINATDATENFEGEQHFGNVFTFTDEEFQEKLNSDLSCYPIAWAVMASCTFPGVFNYMTLRDYRDLKADDDRYLHLFDGGNSDNLGLESIKKIILNSMFWGDEPAHKHYVVILIDAYPEVQGADSTDYDPRSLVSNVFDTNVLDAFDSLMRFRRDDLLGQFRTGILDVNSDQKICVENLTFWHITFGDIDPAVKDHEKNCLQNTVSRIPTSFSLSEDDQKRIDKAVDTLITRDNPQVIKILRALYGNG